MAILGGGGTVGESGQCMWLRIVLFIQAQSWRSISTQLPDWEISATKCSSSLQSSRVWVPRAPFTPLSSPHTPRSSPPSAFLSSLPLSRWTAFSGASPSLPYTLAPSSVSLLSFQLLSCLCPTSPPVLPSVPTPPCFWVSPHTLFPFLSWLHTLCFYPTPQQRNISLFGIPLPSFSLSHTQKLPILWIYIYIYFKVALCGMRGLISRTRDWTRNPCIRSVES